MSKRIICNNTSAFAKMPDIYEVLRCLHEAGYTHFDLTLTYEGAANGLLARDDWKEECHKLRSYAKGLGLECAQAHAFYTKGIEQELIQKRIDLIKKSVLIAKEMGAPLIVVHPIWELPMEDNVAFLKNFLPLLKETGIQMAVENVWGIKDDRPSVMVSSRPELMKELLDRLNDEHYVACLDIGHAEMKDMHTSAVEFVKTLGSRIKTLHIHDNQKDWDLHQIPYIDKIDFDAVFKELRGVGYEGPIDFEVNRCFATFPKELYPSILRFLKEIGEYFISILDK